MPRAGPRLAFALLLLLCAPAHGVLEEGLVHPRHHVLSRPDDPLDVFTRDVAQAHSVAVPGQERRAVIACFADVKADTAKQRLQTTLMLNWARLLGRLELPCVVGVCNAQAPRRADFRDFLLSGGCAVVHAPLAACVQNARLGRWSYVKQINAWGFDVLSSDPDIAFVRDPRPYFGELLRKHPHVDVLSMSDASTGRYTLDSLLELPHAGSNSSLWDAFYPETPRPGGPYVRTPAHAGYDSGVADILQRLASGTHQLGLEDPGNCNPHQWNTGYMYWRATPRAATLLDAWVARLEPQLPNSMADDQLPFCQLGRENSLHCATDGNGPMPTPADCGGDGRLNPVAGGKACFGLLNLAQFANGFVYQVARLHEQHSVPAMIYHATYSSDKRQSLQEEGFWVYANGDELRRRRATFLSYDNPVPPSYMMGHYTNWSASWHLVQLQAQRLRTALALSRALNRTLVLPRLAATCQCFFYGIDVNSCMCDGLRVRLPYAAPTDHWIKPGSLAASFAVVSPGFLARRDTPVWLRANVARVRVSPGARWSDATARAQLAPHAGAAVLHLEAEEVRGAFEAFEQPAEQARFDADLADVLGSWCCLNNGTHPNVVAMKARYTFFGAPRLTPADDAASRHGICGA